MIHILVKKCNILLTMHETISNNTNGMLSVMFYFIIVTVRNVINAHKNIDQKIEVQFIEKKHILSIYDCISTDLTRTDAQTCFGSWKGPSLVEIEHME